MSNTRNPLAGKITTKSVLKTAFLPGIFPRIRELGAHFGHFAYMLALIYRACRLIPENHPVLKPENAGRFGFRTVIGAAANNLVFSRSNIDQILIFFAVLIGLVLFVLQFITVLFLLIFDNAAYAQGNTQTVSSLFTIPAGNNTTDIAYRFMDRVFGVPGIFETGESIPNPLHNGIHVMFSMYSYALLIIAAIIVAYYIVTVVAETAQTGVPFGRRFNNVWAPIRLVIAIGLLVPITHGLNTSQYITLYTAKIGSNLATNIWNAFHLEIMKDKKPLAKPYLSPQIGNVIQHLFLSRICQKGYNRVIRGATTSSNDRNFYAGKLNEDNSSAYDDLITATDFSQMKDIVDDEDENLELYWSNTRGEYDLRYKTGMEPYTCGSMELPWVQNNTFQWNDAIRQVHYDFVRNIERNQGIGSDIQATAEEYVAAFYTGPGQNNPQANAPDVNTTRQKFISWVRTTQQSLNQQISTIRDQANAAQQQAAVDQELEKKGWAAAGTWYFNIAQMNGNLADAVERGWRGTRLPYVMRKTEQHRAAIGKPVDNLSKYIPVADPRNNTDYGMDNKTRIGNHSELAVARTLSNAYSHWIGAVETATYNNGVGRRGYIVALLMQIFGVQGLFDMAEKDPDVIPLAQITMIGKTILNSSLTMLTMAVAAGVGGAFAGLIPIVGDALQHLATLVATLMFFFGMVGLSIGFFIYYVVPMMPFIYFLFAIVNWVAGVFEAMVGAPLWALAHLRIDGDGMPGQAAMNGYYMFLQILLRPTLIIFGFIAGIIIFSAGVKMVHELFHLFQTNLTITHGEVQNYDIIDRFFFAIVYAIILFNLGMLSFKLVDRIPNEILRWMGQGGPSSFSDGSTDPMGSMQSVVMGVGAATYSGIQTAQQSVGNFSNFAKSTGSLAGRGLSKFKTPTGVTPGGGTPPKGGGGA